MLGEHLGGLVAAAQVARVRLPQAAEVDHALDALAQGHARERLRAGELAGREVAARSSAHRVDQVVGDLHVAARPLQRLGAEDIALVDLEAAPLEVACACSVAHHAADGPTGVRECRREPRADEAGRARHERPPPAGGRRPAGVGCPFESVMRWGEGHGGNCRAPHVARANAG